MRSAKPSRFSPAAARMIALVEAMQPGVDVAAQRLDAKLWMALAQLGLAAQAGGSDRASCRQLVERSILRRDESVARILARHDRSQGETLRDVHRYVLERMRREIRTAVRHRLLELLDEESLAAEVGERLIEGPVPLCRQSEQLDDAARIERAQVLADVLGLPHRQRRLARRDDELRRTGRVLRGSGIHARAGAEKNSSVPGRRRRNQPVTAKRSRDVGSTSCS